MRKPFIFIAALLIFFCITCKKEYSYEGGPLALYTLNGAPNECQNYVVLGNYYHGVSLDTTDVVKVIADVRLAGRYFIVSDTVDGISFSSSGTFMDTGFQPITLVGSGVPASIGSFTIEVLGDSSCTFSVNVNDLPQATYTLSGTPNDCTAPIISGTYYTGKTLNDSNTVTENVLVAATGSYSISTNVIDGISFSASGVFAATGNQQIVLQGSGTINNSGRFYFTTTAVTSQCTFSIPVESNAPYASYVLESGLDVCAEHTVSGSYIANTPLNIADSLTLEVYVSVVGNFTVATSKLNGIIFSNLGSFTTTGDQIIALYGKGTPVSSGTFTFVPEIIGYDPLGGESCGIDVTVQ